MNVQTEKFTRLGIVGIFSTTVDLLVLNALIIVIGLNYKMAGLFILFKSISFLAGTANSFIFDKIWLFQEYKDSDQRLSKEASAFLWVNAFSLVLNVALSYVIFKLGATYVSDIPAHNLANAGALLGCLAVFVSNFIGYKVFVFKASPEQQKYEHVMRMEQLRLTNINRMKKVRQKDYFSSGPFGTHANRNPRTFVIKNS